MSQFCEEQTTQREGLRLRTLVPQNSDEVERIKEDGDVVREEAKSFISQPNSNTRVKAFPGFIIAISLIQLGTFYTGGPFCWLYLVYDPSRRHEVWRLLTHMFAHHSGSHLWRNLIIQLIFGVHLEIHHHWKRTAIIYTGGVLGGSLFSTFFTPDEFGLGASAGVCALIFAQVAIVLLNWNYIGNKCACSLFLLIVACKVYLDGLSVYNGLVVVNASNVKISQVGHFGGALTGFLISILVLKNLEERHWVKLFKRICAAIVVSLTLIIVLTNIACPSLYPQTEFNTDYEETFLLRYFKIMEKRLDHSESDQLFLINCLKNKQCADAWDDYKNTGKVNSADFIHKTAGMA